MEQIIELRIRRDGLVGGKVAFDRCEGNCWWLIPIRPRTRIDYESLEAKRFRKWVSIQWGTEGRVRMNRGNAAGARFHAFIVHYIFIARPAGVVDALGISSAVYAAELQTARFHLGAVLSKLRRNQYTGDDFIFRVRSFCISIVETESSKAAHCSAEFATST